MLKNFKRGLIGYQDLCKAIAQLNQTQIMSGQKKTWKLLNM